MPELRDRQEHPSSECRAEAQRAEDTKLVPGQCAGGTTAPAEDLKRAAWVACLLFPGGDPEQSEKVTQLLFQDENSRPKDEFL